MGTRAQFFVGDPRNIEAREWLGAVAWDGYPDGDIGEALKNVIVEKHFREAIAIIAKEREDFCDPSKNDFPFPWHDDLFLTDYTYAFFDGKVQFTYYHRGFIALNEYRENAEIAEKYAEGAEELARNVPAPERTGKPPGPDSIMIITL
jgi:hypothetical protein